MRQDILCVLDDKQTLGFAEIQIFNSSERILRALKIFSVFLGVTLLSVLVPILHFVLVPLFGILGIAFSIATWLTKAKVLSGEFQCPSCNHKNLLEPHDESFPKSIRCSSCHITLSLKKS